MNVLHGAIPQLIAHSSVHYRPNATHLWQEVYTNIEYSHFAPNYGLYGRRLSHAAMSGVAEVCFCKPKEKSLHGALTRAIDSLNLARELALRPISLVLLWTAIESLISPGKDDDSLTTNLALTLVGLNAPLSGPQAFFVRAKKEYGLRSSIVHSFRVPADIEIADARVFAHKQACDLIRAARDAATQGISRDEFRLRLQRQAFTAGVLKADSEQIFG